MQSLMYLNLQLRTKFQTIKITFSNSLATSSTIKPNGSIININPTKKLHMDEFNY